MVLQCLNTAFGFSKKLSATSGNFKTPSIKALQKPSFFKVLIYTFSFLNFEYQGMGWVTQKSGYFILFNMLRVSPGRGSLMHNRSHRLICGEVKNRIAVSSKYIYSFAVICQSEETVSGNAILFSLGIIHKS